MTMTPADRNAAIDQALAAKERLNRLQRSPDFIKRYAADDPDAVDAVRELGRRIAHGTEIATEDLGRLEAQRSGVEWQPDPEASAAAKEAHRQQVDALANNDGFVKKLQAGDPAAVRQWRELDASAANLGLSPEEARPAVALKAPAAAEVSAQPVAVGAAS